MQLAPRYLYYYLFNNNNNKKRRIIVLTKKIVRATVNIRGGEEFASDSTTIFENDNNNNTGEIIKINPSTISSYYLIWSRGFVPKFVLSLFVVSALNKLIQFYNWNIFNTATLLQNWVLPLLSSSCCLIQVLYNIMVVGSGCAGFNTYLGPVRPYFMSLLVAMTMTNSHMLSMKSIMLRTTLTFLPELLYVWNSKIIRWKSHKLKSTTSTNGTLSGSKKSATITLDVPTMGCVACINKIDTSIHSNNSIPLDNVTSWLHDKTSNNNNDDDDGSKKGGQVQVNVPYSTQEELDTRVQQVVDSVQRAGFESCTVESVATTTTTKE